MSEETENVEDTGAYDADDFVNAIQQYSNIFDDMCIKRHTEGAEEYGAFTFLENDVIRMMAEELVDTANYARMQFIKLLLLQEALSEQLTSEVGDAPYITIGIESFRGTKNGWQK